MTTPRTGSSGDASSDFEGSVTTTVCECSQSSSRSNRHPAYIILSRISAAIDLFRETSSRDWKSNAHTTGTLELDNDSKVCNCHFLYWRNGEITMADFFRMALNGEPQVNASSFFGPSSVALSDFSCEMTRTSNLRFSANSSEVSVPASTFADQKCDGPTKNSFAPDCQAQYLTVQSDQRSATLAMAERAEHRVNCKL